MNAVWKVPGRTIVCNSLSSWIKEIVWCYVVIKIWPDAVELTSRVDGECPWCNSKMV